MRWATLLIKSGPGQNAVLWDLRDEKRLLHNITTLQGYLGRLHYCPLPLLTPLVSPAPSIAYMLFPILCRWLRFGEIFGCYCEQQGSHKANATGMIRSIYSYASTPAAAATMPVTNTTAGCDAPLKPPLLPSVVVVVVDPSASRPPVFWSSVF